MTNRQKFRTKTPAMIFAGRRLTDGFNVLISLKKGCMIVRRDNEYTVEWFRR